MDEYIRKIAVPQVKEILTNYGPIAVLWWDTPDGHEPKSAPSCCSRCSSSSPASSTTTASAAATTATPKRPSSSSPPPATPAATGKPA